MNYEGKGIDTPYNKILIKSYGKGLSIEETQGLFDAQGLQKDTDDPYNKLGYGFIAYFRVLHVFFCLFLLFSLMLIPVFYTYQSHSGLDMGSSLEKYSLGSFGFSGTTCSSQYVGYWNKTETESKFVYL